MSTSEVLFRKGNHSKKKVLKNIVLEGPFFTSGDGANFQQKITRVLEKQYSSELSFCCAKLFDMKFADNFQTLAQAYLIEGDNEIVERELVSALETLHGIEKAGNPDFWIGRSATFTIEEARNLKEMASRRSSGHGKRVFVINAGSFTREASNALLKTLEEPQQGTHFFIILPNLDRVLPTILSRVRTIKTDFLGEQKIISTSKFLALSAPQRISFIKEIMTKAEKEEFSKTDIQNLIEDIIRQARKSIKGKESLKRLGGSASVAAYATDQSASLKMILEYLALAL